MSIVIVDELPRIRKENRGKKIVFCSGGFDVTHVGHILFFEDCKKLGDILVVAVARDASLRKRKGSQRPILNEHIRTKTIDSLKPVDYVFMNPQGSVEDLLYTIRLAFEKLSPDMYVINEDAFDIPAREQLAAEYHVKLIVLPRSCPPEFENISTSKIIEKIQNLKDEEKEKP